MRFETSSHVNDSLSLERRWEVKIFERLRTLWRNQPLARLGRDERGATAVEYGILVALIAAVIVTVVMTLGKEILAAFETVVKAL